MLEIEMTSIAVLLAANNQMNEELGPHLRVYRGHSSTEFKLVPSIFRRAEDPDRELAYFLHFREHAISRRPDCPELNDWFGWALLMRHYGLKTRLLDWTYSPLVAAFFAVCTAPPTEDAVIWVMAAEQMNYQFGCSRQPGTMLLDSQTYKDFMGIARMESGRLDRKCSVAAIAVGGGPQLDRRMMLQQGIYSLHGISTPLEECPQSKGCLMKLLIPKSRRLFVAKQLRFLGIRLSSLFDDLGSLATELNASFGNYGLPFDSAAVYPIEDIQSNEH